MIPRPMDATPNEERTARLHCKCQFGSWDHFVEESRARAMAKEIRRDARERGCRVRVTIYRNAKCV